MNKLNSKSFTLIEILVVATIIGLLASGAVAAYTQFTKQSRDAKRKADLEEIRAALEMYKSNSATGLYPTTGAFNFSTCSPGSFSDATYTYLSKVPNDPKCTTYIYYFSSANGTTYTLAAKMEGTSTCASPPGANSCGSGVICDYCLGPYGQN